MANTRVFPRKSLPDHESRSEVKDAFPVGNTIDERESLWREKTVPSEDSTPVEIAYAQTPGDPQDYQILQRRLGYEFRHPELLLSALTHKSFVRHAHRQEPPEHNERLEFAGDAILGAAVASYLYQAYPHYEEGELSKLKAAVVSRPSLAQCAQQIGLDAFMRLGPEEVVNGGAVRSRYLCDCFEAVVASIFLDGGFQPAYDFVVRNLKSQIEHLAADAIKWDYKTALQERCQGLMLDVQYETVAELGPAHARFFEVVVRVMGRTLGYGAGRRRKSAEQRAACMALQYLDENACKDA